MIAACAACFAVCRQAAVVFVKICHNSGLLPWFFGLEPFRI